MLPRHPVATSHVFPDGIVNSAPAAMTDGDDAPVCITAQ
jgi:hypothetical protein